MVSLSGVGAAKYQAVCGTIFLFYSLSVVERSQPVRTRPFVRVRGVFVLIFN